MSSHLSPVPPAFSVIIVIAVARKDVVTIVDRYPPSFLHLI
jgi:hypothetical protein